MNAELFNAMRGANLTPSEGVKVMAMMGMDAEGRPLKRLVAPPPLPSPPPPPVTPKPVGALKSPRTSPKPLPMPVPQKSRLKAVELKLVNRIPLKKTVTVARTSKSPLVSKQPRATAVAKNVNIRRKLRLC